MKQTIFLVLALIMLEACIPIRVAPKIEDYKISEGKRFKRGLPKTEVFLFEDPKQADEFYNYINAKFDLDHYYVDTNVPFILDDVEYFFSFYEVEVPDKSLNLLPIFADVMLDRANMDPVFEDAHQTRKGNYYIAIEVNDALGNNLLSQTSIQKEKVVQFLKRLKGEYLNTTNYNEVVFKN